MRRRTWPVLISPLLIAMLAIARPVTAQERPDAIYAAQADLDPAPAFQLADNPRIEATGVRFGNYVVRPTLSLSTRQDSSAGTDGNGQSARAVVIAPAVELLTKSANTRFKTYVRGSAVRHERHGSEDLDMLNAGFNYYHAPRADMAIAVRAQFGRFSEDRTEIFTATNNARPIIFDQYQANAGLSYRAGRFVISPAFGLERRAYHDNRHQDAPHMILPQKQRSNMNYGPAFEVGYALSPDTLFYGGSYFRRLERITRVIPSQDATEFTTYAGLRIQPTPLTRLKLAAGWQKRRYTGLLASPKGLYYNASLEYSATPLTLVTFKASRELLDSSAIQIGSSLNQRMRGDITHALRRNLRLSVYGAIETFKLHLPKRTTQRSAAGINAEYSASDHLDWLFSVDWQQKKIKAMVAPYHFDRLRISASMKVKL